MKALVLSALVAFSVSAQAQTAQELLAQGQEAYAARDFSQPGVAKAQEAAGLFAKAAAASTDRTSTVQALIGVSESVYFVALAAPDKDMKIDLHWKGYEAGDKVAKLYGINDVQKVADADVENLKKLPANELALLGEALFHRGANLGQWGSANGVAQSLGKWPELRDNMDLIVKLGLKDLREYGAYRTLGRGYFKIPALLGGSVAKAEKYLATAVQGSLAAGQIYSVNGFNNLFYAEILKDQGQDQKAKDLLQAFLKADPNTLHSKLVPENKLAQREAATLLKSW